MQTFRNIERQLGLIPARLGQQLSAIDIARGRQEMFRDRHPAVLDALKQVALIQSVEASNAIEAITAPADRLRDLVADKTTPVNRSEEEIAGYRAVLDTIHASAHGIPFKPSVIEQLHRDLHQFTGIRQAGRWKTTDNKVTEEFPDGTVAVRFTPVSAFETPRAMEELHERFNAAWEAEQYHRLLLIGGYILDFLVIHPFNDGNGRMSRLLALLLLYKAGYEVGRFVSLEKLIERTAESYYDALGKSTVGWHDGKHDVTPWLSYFLGIVVAACDELESRLAAVTSGRGAKAELVKQFIRSNISETFRIEDVRRAAPGVSDVYLTKILGELRRAGAITLLGRGRSATWKRVHTNF